MQGVEVGRYRTPAIIRGCKMLLRTSFAIPIVARYMYENKRLFTVFSSYLFLVSMVGALTSFDRNPLLQALLFLTNSGVKSFEKNYFGTEKLCSALINSMHFLKLAI